MKILFFEGKVYKLVLRSFKSLLKLIQLIINFLGKTFPDLVAEVVLQFVDLIRPELLGGGEERLQIDLVFNAFNVEAVGSGHEPDGRPHSRCLVAIAATKCPVYDANVVAKACLKK